MDTGLKYEGEEARKRFIVYWLRPAIAALGFGVFTFVVVAVPGEKEKIGLRGELQHMRSENDGLEQRLRDMVPYSRLMRSSGLTTVPLGSTGNDSAWGRVLYDDHSGSGMVVVEGLRAEGQRAFCWWLDLEQARTPLAAISLESGAGHAMIQLGPGREGSFLVTLEPLEGEPGPDGPVVLEAEAY